MILVFGGSFDPVHNGHIAMADAAQRAKQPEKILWVPSRHAPHKPATPPASAAERVAYLHAVVDQRPGEEVCTMEIQREGLSYTVDTLRELETQYPTQDLYFLLGGDSLSHLTTWRELSELFRRVSFLFAPRCGWGPESLEPFRDALPDSLRADFRAEFISMQEVHVSSTEVRLALSKGQVPADVPAAVVALLKEFGKV
ncbi:MAG: nicotinate (nicotinamide) nucleotide adenylyltransferase [Planctomycetota bacterium]|nr:nicotinate (nicotinamide) nucleotide adenylyltransferase [Planctomycetota bacterium]MDA1113042.1 nicotinate (nicotinamide) nucleotide adenylyltransferase [Planctomycetota bacterium]